VEQADKVIAAATMKIFVVRRVIGFSVSLLK
jgi:hypothetical protein